MGTVGTGVAWLLVNQADRLALHAGRPLRLRRVVVRDAGKPRDIQLPPGTITDDLSVVLHDPDITIVAQLVGGLEPARSIMCRLLESGKDVVTANKALLAEHGPELFALARRLGRSIAFEASVAGGVPIITTLAQSLSANQVTSLHGILNGTSNFIVSEMELHGVDYEAAQQDAQRRGYAEADPQLDVDGTDAAQKLAILAHLAFGAHVHWQEIPREGIAALQLADLKYARELGYRIKLLAVAQLANGHSPADGLDLHVAPTLVRIGTPLAEVRGANNAVSVSGDAVGRVFLLGAGAGQMPTASAVVADIVDMAVGRTQLTFKTLQLWSAREARVKTRTALLAPGRYYLRLHVDDHPGVLADIAGILGRRQISIASVIQHEPVSDDATGQVDLVIMTHGTTEGAMRQALADIGQLDCLREKRISRMRVLD
jgi:homoserine dehydrogenase